MPVATERGVFNADLFKKRVRLADSADGDGSVAVRQAIKQCAQADPPKLFHEAIVEAFGSGKPKGDDRLHDRATRAEAEAAELRRASVNMTTRIEQQERIAGELRTANLQLSQQLDEAIAAGQVREHESEGGWPTLFWVHPDTLIADVCVFVFVEWAAGAWLASEPGTIYFRLGLHNGTMFFFAVWSVAVFKTMGLKKLGIRWAIWTFGWLIVTLWIAVLHGGIEAFHDSVTFMEIPSYWWSGCAFNPTGNDLWIVLSALYVIYETNTDWQVTSFITRTVKNWMD